MSTAVRALILAAIAENPVMIFSKSYCPYCTRVKALFDELKVVYKALELDLDEQGQAIQAALKELTGQSTVPNVYVNGTHVGGCDSTIAANKSGKLKELLDSSAPKPKA
ncbi:thioredoxin reductase [Entomortierella chlamydospora]|uniref:Thioredoxin reductase n=1 Tax=Entomortierella chlamydospora TaxID=101097 RepID=A0A9P6T3Z8_9FUNG|nr:thioredoxin reductase [Entomortierella chlamydospora]KAG0023178.1 thioredoxin reductase [Entomortierella chlamydospora]